MSTAPAIDLAIFDLDGTLADTVPDIAHTLNRTLVDAGLPPLTIETIIGFVGDGAAKLIERALPPSEQGRDVAPLLERFLALYEEQPCLGSRIYPGVVELLDGLAAAGTATAVITNKVGAVARLVLDVLLPGHRFVAIVGDRDGFARKPDPAAGRALIARAGTEASRTVMIGDGIPDIRMAHALMVRSVAVAWGYTTRERLLQEAPTWVADVASDVPRLIAQPTPVGAAEPRRR